jgi:hypothetical protein
MISRMITRQRKTAIMFSLENNLLNKLALLGGRVSTHTPLTALLSDIEITRSKRYVLILAAIIRYNLTAARHLLEFALFSNDLASYIFEPDFNCFE